MAAKKERTAISPTRAENFPEWYQQVVRVGELAETAPVRGCMVIKPWGYALWENMQRVLDRMFKETGHVNAYFPLFIPKSFMEKEAEHVEGFATECAVVTHTRLTKREDGTLVPDSPLEEPLIVRPTSEMIIGATYSKWVQSYRDLPLLINQWANVVRWEMRPRLFLRTTEFLWQEGHTVHATAEEAWEETERILGLYAEFAEDFMAMPVVRGEKTESERFPGAERTLTIEALMQDRKALQSGTSHYFGQKFARANDITFLNTSGEEVHAWTTSWGVSTRLIGGLVMTHGDDNGLILPPRLAPVQVVLLPVIHEEATRHRVLEFCEALKLELTARHWHGESIRVEIDSRDLRGGEKMWQWIKKGVPVRIEIGPRDLAGDSVFVGRRDRSPRDRYSQKRGKFIESLAETLEEIQNHLFEKARAFQDGHTRVFDDRDEFYRFFAPQDTQRPEIHGGLALAHWCGDPEVEARLSEELKVTIRCIPFVDDPKPGRCIFTGRPSPQRVVFAKAY